MEKTSKSPNFPPKTVTNNVRNITATDLPPGLSGKGKELAKNDAKIGYKRRFSDVDVEGREYRCFNGGSEADANKGLSSSRLVSPKIAIIDELEGNQHLEEKKKGYGDENGSGSANAMIMESQNQKVWLTISTGGAWEEVNEVFEYVTSNFMRRIILLPLNSTYSELMNRVAKKLNLDPQSGFWLSYKFPSSSSLHNDNEVIEIGDDDEVSALIDLALNLSRGMLTLCVVESVISGGDNSSSGSNHRGNVAPLEATPNIYKPTLNNEKEKEKEKNDVGLKKGVDVKVQKDIPVSVASNQHFAKAEKDTSVRRMPNVCYEPSAHFPFVEMFINKEVLIQCLQLKSAKEGSKFRTMTSTNEIYVAICSSFRCEWQIRASKVNASFYRGMGIFKIRKFNSKHTCLNVNPSRALPKKQNEMKKEDTGECMLTNKEGVKTKQQ